MATYHAHRVEQADKAAGRLAVALLATLAIVSTVHRVPENDPRLGPEVFAHHADFIGAWSVGPWVIAQTVVDGEIVYRIGG